MPTPFAINGLGRIGRALLRIARGRPDLELAAVNDLASADQLARMIARDTIHGRYDGEVSAAGGDLLVDGRRIRVFNEPEPADVPWEEADVHVVIDATGLCKEREMAVAHLRKTVRKVIVSANAAGMDRTICIGVNEAEYDPSADTLISGASCTTNCLAPIAYLLHRNYGLRRGMLNTVHSYNNDQRLLESPHPDPRRARAAALNMVPTTTSAVEATCRVLPELDGRLAGFAVRVPTPNVSLIDFVAELESGPSIDELHDLFRQAEAGPMAGILATTEEELVSHDFLRDPHSAIVDLPLTQAIDSHLYRVVAWYDNEWGHASRLVDILELVSSRLEA